MASHGRILQELTTVNINKIIVYVSFFILIVTALSCSIVFCVRIKHKKLAPVVAEEIKFSDKIPRVKSSKGTKGKKKSKRSKKVLNSLDDSSSVESGSYSSSISETSSLLSESRSEDKISQHNSTMNKALRSTFNSVLTEGLTLILHSSDQPMMQVRMTLHGSELRWRSKKVFSTKSYKIQLREIQFIEWGKQTANFKGELCELVSLCLFNLS